MEDTRLSLLERVRDTEDAAAWDEFVHLYEPLLAAYVRKRGVPDHDADDVVQTIFINLLRALPTFRLDRARGRFRTWLYRVTANAVSNWRRGRRAAEAVVGAWPEGAEAATEDPEPGAEWDEAHRRRVAQFALERVKARTAEKTWACFEQHVLLGRPGAEVGGELGLPANTVYVHSARVLERVREQCEGYLERLGER